MALLVNPADIPEIKSKLSPASRVVITTHRNPDGDAMGSSLALSIYLNIIGVNAKVILPNECPDFLKWMKGTDECIDHSKDPELAEKLFNEASVLFCLDFNAPKRVEKMEGLIRDFKGTTIMIDHHPGPEAFARYSLSRPDYGSTCELIYKFITELWDKPINADIGDCLYTGIMTDTGSFRFPSTTAETHSIIAALMEHGADHVKIHRAVYDDFTESRMKLLGHCLGNKMVVHREFQTAYIALTQEELDRFGFQKGDTEGIVNYPLAIRGIVFSAIFIEMDGQIKISFRSKGTFPANKFSSENFNGGGHMNAAGGSSDETLEQAVAKFVSLLPEYKPQTFKL
jgi:bifunctional oligoribonuclease and PAP phosphatase NrnA